MWAGFVLVSLNLRLIFATVGPLLTNLELGFASTLLVTTLPLALLGVFSVPAAPAAVNVYRHRTARSITLFFGLQALNLYVFLPWMPTMLMDRGVTQSGAAMIFSASQLSLMVGSFVTPLLAARKSDQRPWIVATVASCLAGTLGLMYAPAGSAIFWAVVLGFGQGAGPSLGAFLFVAKASSIETATRISAMAQTVGYLIALAGPVTVGAIYHRTGDWHLPILILSAILVLELLVSLPAGRNVKV